MAQDSTVTRRRSLRRLLPLALALLLVLVVGVSMFFLLREDAPAPGPAPEPPSSAPVTVPAEGALVVGSGTNAVEVPQVPCTVSDDGSFQCDALDTEVTVSSPPGSLPLEAGVSTAFTVSTVSLEGGAAPISFVDGSLSFEGAAPGQYSVTVLGEEQDDRRAYWSFVLEVTG